MIQDVRDALRGLRAAPVVTGAAILSLALGIGAASAVFSVVDGVLLKPLPVAEQNQLLVVWKSLPDRAMADWPFEFTSYERLRARVHTLSDVEAHPYSGTVGDVAYVDDVARPLTWTFVTGGWFELVGVQPALGRLLAASDDGVGADPVIVLSSGAATRVFGGPERALGRRLKIWATTYTVVGVAPVDFAYPRGTEAWVPVSGARTSGFLAWHLMARIAPGFSIEQARADLQAALASLPNEAGSSSEAIQMASFADVIVGDVRPGLLVLGAAVLLMLTIAGVNVANLLLVRGLSRQRELAIRTAIGASRWRLVRQFAAESFLIAGTAAVIGLFASSVALNGLLALAPAELPRVSTISLDERALLFVVALAIVTAVLVGLLPALNTTRIAPASALRLVDRGAARCRTSDWMRHALVAAQVALATLVLATAGLLLKSFDRLQRLDLGFGASGVVLAHLDLPDTANPADAQRRMMRVAERVAAMPDVVNATSVVAPPFAGSQGVDGLLYAEGQLLSEEATPYSNYEGVDKAYFETLGLPILRGRGIDEHDRAGTEPVVVVNETFGRLFWPGLDPVGRRVAFSEDRSAGKWMTVVGVVGDARYRDLTGVRPSVYVPYEQGIPVTPQYLAIRTRRLEGVAPAIAMAVADQEPDAAVVSLVPLPDLLAAPLARPRFQSALVAVFAALGLLLSVVGTYGVLSFFVQQRSREIGIRIALGAGSFRILSLVLRKGAVVGVVGVGIGLSGAVIASGLLQPLLFGVSAADPVVLAGTACLLLTTVLVAALLPARLASATSPLIVMKGE